MLSRVHREYRMLASRKKVDAIKELRAKVLAFFDKATHAVSHLFGLHES